MPKDKEAYKTIGEVTKILNLRSRRNKSIPTHTIRFWEKEFKQIKPKIFIGNRRYYDEKNIQLLKKSHYLRKAKGMTINGVKKILNNKEPLKHDGTQTNSLNTHNLKNKLVKISHIIKSLKNIKEYG